MQKNVLFYKIKFYIKILLIENFGLRNLRNMILFLNNQFFPAFFS